MMQISALLASFGGWNWLKAIVMIVFCAIGPIFRTCSQIAVLVCPMPLHWRWNLHEVSRYSSVFFAYEVLILAGPVFCFTLHDMTKDLLTEDNTAPCGPLNEIYDTETCFEILASLMEGYTVVIIGVAVYILCGFDGSFTQKWMHKQFEPLDDPPPTWHCCACRTPIGRTLVGWRDRAEAFLERHPLPGGGSSTGGSVEIKGPESNSV